MGECLEGGGWKAKRLVQTETGLKAGITACGKTSWRHARGGWRRHRSVHDATLRDITATIYLLQHHRRRVVTIWWQRRADACDVASINVGGRAYLPARTACLLALLVAGDACGHRRNRRGDSCTSCGA